MSIPEVISPLLGRVLVAWFFLSEAIRYGQNWGGTVQLMALKNLPNPEALLFFLLLATLLGCLSLLLGFQAKLGAMTLFVIIVGISVTWHDYWNIESAIDRLSEYQLFARNLAIAGGLLFLIGNGPGRFSLDNAKPAKGGRGGR